MYLPFNEAELYQLVKNQKDQSEKSCSTYYLNTYRKIKNGRIAFNWAAFFFGSLWLLYRKAYLYGLLGLFLIPTGIVGMVLMGLFGNYIYFYFLRENYEDGVRQIGTNIWIPILVSLPIILLMLVLLKVMIVMSFILLRILLS